MIHTVFSSGSQTSGYATIMLSGHQSAQGPVVRELRDGRVEIDTGNGKLTGRPLNRDTATAPRNRAAAIWMPLFAGLH